MKATPDYPTFDLIDHNGARVTSADFRGKYVLVFFGFTNCEMVCPRALSRLTEVLKQLGPDSDNIQGLYVTVDPDRDTPAAMKRFLAERAPAFIGLTGTTEQIAAVADAFRVFARRVEDPAAPGGYRMPHTAITYFLGPDGQFITHFGDGVSGEVVTSRIRDLLTNTAHQANT